MIVYIDPDTYRCYTEQDSGEMRISYDEPLFEGKCAKFIEGYQLIPEGSTWIQEDGKAIRGLMIAPWQDIRILNAYQEQYEAMAADAETIEKAAAFDIVTGVTE